MPVVSLPPSFSNSFWTQDYRRGLETLFNKLGQGIDENQQVFSFIKARALAENDIANALIAPAATGPPRAGFDADDGAVLCMTFRALQLESVKQGEAHKAVAHDLVSLVADPFGEWASGHAARIEESRKVLIDGWLKAYEMAIGDVDKLKHTYVTKSRRADEAEDDAKFAPGSNVGDKYTISPKLSPTGGVVKRTPSVSERITQRFKELRKGSSEPEKTLLSPVSPVFSAGKSDGENDHQEDYAPRSPSKDKGKGKELSMSPMVMSPDTLSPSLPELQPRRPSISIPGASSPMLAPLLLAGFSLPRQVVSRFLTRAAAELPLRKVRFPILGEYTDCFSGEEFVTWLKENVRVFEGSLDRAEDAAKELTERDGALRRIGELGNRFENSKDAYFQFRSKAFELHFVPEDEPLEHQSALSPAAENLRKRTTTLVSIVQKAVSAATPMTSESFHVRARNEAEIADKLYRVAVRKLDRQRLGLEEKIEETLQALQKWEMDRLRSVNMVLVKYQGTITKLPRAFSVSLDRSSVLVSSYQPENDLIALIEQYRTGPFRPTPHVYDSILHDMPDVMFGIDLRKWAGEGGWNAVRAKEDQKELVEIPNIVTCLLAGMNEAYEKLPNDSERRKSWIYNVPLPAVHHFREAINTLPPNAFLLPDLLAKYDAPVIASTLKLWLLELNPPLGLWEGWEDVRKIYPTVGAVAGDEVPEQQRIEDLQIVLLKLPKIHLVVLDAIIKHLKSLIDTTQSEESLDVYITKLGLSLGRAILRPKSETEISIHDRHPTLLFIDLIKHYAEILPSTIARKKRDSLERPIPMRKRTKMVDQRLSRSQISYGANPQQLLAAQHAAQHGPPSRVASPSRAAESQAKRQSIPSASPTPTPAPAATEASKPQEPEAPPVPVPSPHLNVVAPSHPTLAQPAPSVDGYKPPPRPTFVELDNVTNDEGSTVVSPPTAARSPSPVEHTVPAISTTPPAVMPDDEKPLTSKTSLSRPGLGEPMSRVRGPRVARTSGTAKGGFATSSAATSSAATTGPPSRGPSPRPTHNRGTSSVSEHAKEYAPKKNVGRANAAIFSRRSQASDAEDDLLDK